MRLTVDDGVADACERLRLASLLATVAGLLLAALLGPWLGVRWSLAGTTSAALTIAILLGASLRLRSAGRIDALTMFSEILGVLLLGGLAAVAVAMVATRSGAPIADPWLSSADELVGLSAQGIVSWLASFDVSLEALHLIYESSFFQIAASILLLPFLGRPAEAWRLCFLFIVCLLSCAIISFATPAYGTFIDASRTTIEAMPPGAGTFWWGSLDQGRSAEIMVIGLKDFGGVIAFPSFHMIMALLMIQAWSWSRTFRWPVLVANLAVIFTTLPMGGHYFVDLIAGALLWLAGSAVADWLLRDRPVSEPNGVAVPA